MKSAHVYEGAEATGRVVGRTAIVDVVGPVALGKVPVVVADAAVVAVWPVHGRADAFREFCNDAAGIRALQQREAPECQERRQVDVMGPCFNCATQVVK